MKVRALHKFEGLLDLERTEREQKEVYPKAGDVWETSEERALYLKNHGVVEIVEELTPESYNDPVGEKGQKGIVEEIVTEPITEIKKLKKKKTSKK